MLKSRDELFAQIKDFAITLKKQDKEFFDIVTIMLKEYVKNDNYKLLNFLIVDVSGTGYDFKIYKLLEIFCYHAFDSDKKIYVDNVFLHKKFLVKSQFEGLLENWKKLDFRSPKNFNLNSYLSALSEHDRNESNEISEGKLVLFSKGGRRVFDRSTCAECGVIVTNSWFYKNSSKGQVYICLRCKDTVFERSFERVDLLDLTLPGSFGG